MDTPRRDSEDILRLIDQLAADAEHTDAESREVLAQAGVDPDRFVRTVRSAVRPMLRPSRSARVSWEAVRSSALAVAAASAVLFVVLYHVNYRAGIDVQRQSARAQLISQLLPGLASDDPDRRSLARSWPSSSIPHLRRSGNPAGAMGSEHAG